MYGNAEGSLFSTSSTLTIIRAGNRPSADAGVGLSGADGYIPIWGSGRDAIYSFQQGDISRGVLNGAMAVSDIF